MINVTPVRGCSTAREPAVLISCANEASHFAAWAVSIDGEYVAGCRVGGDDVPTRCLICTLVVSRRKTGCAASENCEGGRVGDGSMSFERGKRRPMWLRSIGCRSSCANGLMGPGIESVMLCVEPIMPRIEPGIFCIEQVHPRIECARLGFDSAKLSVEAAELRAEGAVVRHELHVPGHS